MNQPFTTFGYTVTNGVAVRNTPDRLSDVINVKEYGSSVATGGDDTLAIRTAVCEAFGVCSFVGDTGGVSSMTLNVTSVNYGTIKPGRQMFLLSGQVIGSCSGNTITYIAGTLGGTIVVGQLIQDYGNGVMSSGCVVTAINTTTHQITFSGPPATIPGPLPFVSFTLYGPNPLIAYSPPTIAYAGGTGGTGTYTLSQAMTIPVGTPLWCSNGQGGTALNKPLMFPSGNYTISDNIIFLSLTEPHVYGEGGVVIGYLGDGSSGNPITFEPSFFPLFLLAGVNKGRFEDFTFSGSPTFGFNGSQPMIQLVTTATASVGATTLTFNSTNDPINNTTVTPGMVCWDIINDTHRLAGVVQSVTSTTVTIRGDAPVKASLPSNSTIVFAPPIIGLQLDQSFGGTGYCGTIRFRGLNFTRCGRGLFTNGGVGNCDNCSLDQCNFGLCTIAGLQLIGLNVLNWQVRGGGAGGCGQASTCDPALGPTQGNAGAAYSLIGCGLEIDSVSCSGNTWDVCAFGTQGVTINAGRGEQMGRAPYMSQFSGFITAGTPMILTVTSFTRGQAIQPGTLLSADFASISNGAIGGLGLNGDTYVTGPAASGGGSGGVGNYNVANDASGNTSWPPGGGSATMASPGIGRGQSIATDSIITINNMGFGSGVPGVTGGEAMRQLDGFNGGQFIVQGYTFGGQGQSTPGWFAALGPRGTLTSNTSTGWLPQGKIGGGTTSRVYLKNDNMSYAGIPPNLFSSFTGKVIEFTPNFSQRPIPDFTVAMLTTSGTSSGTTMNASPIWSQIRLYVTDYNAVWSNSIIGQSIVGNGGGAHTVPVICPDGVGWVVAGG